MSSWVVRVRNCCAAVALSWLMAGGLGCVFYLGPRSFPDAPRLQQMNSSFLKALKDEDGEIRSLLGDPSAVPVGVSQIKQWKTTKDEVRSLFGRPTAVVGGDPTLFGFSDDDEIWMFWYFKTTYVPPGEYDFKKATLTVVFDSSGVVKHVEYGISRGGMGIHAIFK